MADLNMCLFTGRAGRDPEIRYLASGEATCTLSIAVSKKWKDKSSGETKERTTWVPCVFFGKTAELVGQYVRKGKQIRVTGEWSSREYQPENGDKKQITECKVSDFQMFGGPDGGGAAPAPAPAARPPAAARAPQTQFPDDDIPF